MQLSALNAIIVSKDFERYNMRTIEIGKNDAGQRLDKLITKLFKTMPKALMYKYIRTKRIKVNGKRAKLSQKLVEGDVVDFFIPDEFFEKKAADFEFDRVKQDFDVIYEDENIMLCDKRPGMLVHPGDGDERRSAEVSERETLLFQIKAYLWKKGEYRPENENSFAPALCNRIDRNTGGIVIAAKNALALRRISG